MKNQGAQTKPADASVTNKIQEMEEKISGVENMVEEIDSSVEENVESKKIPKIKHPVNVLVNFKTISRTLLPDQCLLTFPPGLC